MAKAKHLRIKKSNFDKVCAAALAGGMVLSVMSPTAFAMEYNAADGTVHVSVSENESVLSWQDNNADHYDKDTAYDHTAEKDNVIEITGSGGSEDPTDDEIIIIDDGVTGVKDEEGNENESLEVSINDVNVAGTEDAAIQIGDDADVDLTIKDTTIKEAKDDGINIGNGSTVDITFEGDNYFSGTGSDNNTSGIQVGSSGDTGSEATGNDSTVTITGTTGEDGSGASFTVETASNGVYIGRNDSVTIDGGNPDGEGNLDIVIKDTVGTDKADSTTSGRAIVNYGDLTITSGADVTIEGVSTGTTSNAGYGIVTNVTDSTGEDSGFLEISGEETNVTIKDTSATGILVESYKGTQAGELIIDGATVEVANNGGSGIWLDSSNATIQNGATVSIENASGHSINMGTITTASEEVVENTLEITGEDTEVTIKDGGSAGINASNYKTVNIEDDAKVIISKTKTDAVRVWRDASLIVQGAELDAAGRSIMLYNSNPTEGMARMAVLNDAKVVVRDVYRYRGTSERVELIVLGGTLELTSSGTDEKSGLTSSYYQTLPDSVQDGNTYLVWPTNGAVYGNEKLVNFQLPADEAHALFETFGWKDGKAVPYADDYSCDLSKYEEGEMLSVWVPAVILDYYYKDKLPEGTSFENMTEDEVLALLENTVFKGQDAIIRGQSVSFATLNQTYTSNNTADTSKTWYYFDAEGNLQSFNADTKIVAQNLKNIYGLDVIEEEPTPDEPGTDDPATPVTPIVKPEDPKAPVVIEELPAAPEVPEAPAEEISAEPQVKLPQTGQNWALTGLLAIAGGLMAAIGITPHKRRKDEHEV